MEQITELNESAPATHALTRIPARTDAELLEIARAFNHGGLVTHLHFEPKEMGKVFLSIDLGYFRDWEAEELAQVGLVFQFMDKKLPEKNPHKAQLPKFFTCEVLSHAQYARVLELLAEVGKGDPASATQPV